jgi:hypothetical protein
MKRDGIAKSALVILAFLAIWAASPLIAETEQNAAVISYERNDEQGTLAVSIDGREAFVYQYAEDLDLPHFHPLRSPDGKSMLVDKTDPYPHHRAFWFGDKVRKPGGPAVEIYNAYYTGVDRKDPPYRNHVRHLEFDRIEADGNTLDYSENLVWIMDRDVPLLDERRTVRVKALGKGEYLIDIRFEVVAAHGDIEFVSDSVHYAWPYLRMNKEFSVDGGGRIVNSEGGVNQKGSNNKIADWVDYSNTAGGKNAGLAVMSHPENDKPHRWLTRDYGTFGPRRIDARSGKRFTLKAGESMQRRVGVLVHVGDHETGRVAKRYAEYADCELD